MNTRVQTAAPYTIREVTESTEEEWDRWLVDSPGGGHALQSHRWGEFKRGRGWRPVRLLLERGGEVAGAGQFLLRSTLPVPGSLMYCTKGPWLPWGEEGAVRAFFGGARRIAEREGAHTVKIEPEVPEENGEVKALLGGMGFAKARYDLHLKTTVTMDLSPSEEELLAAMKGKKGKTTRYNIRLAARKGVEVVEPEDFEEAWESFYGLTELTAERGGYSIMRSREYFRDAARAMRDAGRAHLFFAEHEGERLAGMLVYTLGNKYWYMAGASSNEKRKLMPSYLLQWEVMRWAKSRGLTHYDMFGIPKPENLDEGDSLWGVYRFKIGFGGEVTNFLGCLDLPVKGAQAAAWHRFEPVYYRLYQRLRNDIFY